MAQAIGGVDYLFQSTPPVRGATNDPDHAPNLWVFQSTPPVRGATDKALLNSRSRTISIHAPRAGGDAIEMGLTASSLHFNPRPPCGGRRHPAGRKRYDRHFNPRPPCGGRRARTLWVAGFGLFQSTPPVRGATWCSRRRHIRQRISIHAPRAGGDIARAAGGYQIVRNFNPRPPCGGRLGQKPLFGHHSGNFNPRPPCGGRPPRPRPPAP